jgi:hypothetical protein
LSIALQRSGFAGKPFAASAALTRLASRRTLGRLITGSALLLFVGLAHAQVGCLDITAHGGDNTGTNDNVGPFNTTVALLSGTGGCIGFPPGRYLFKSAISLTYPASTYSVTIAGGGSDNTTLYFWASNGLTVATQNTGTILQSIHVRDLTFTTGKAGLYSALQIVNPGASTTFPQSDIVRTNFRGDDGSAQTDYWLIAANVYGLSNINFDGDLFYGNSANTGGTGINLTGVSGGIFYSNITKSGFYSLGYGLGINSYVSGLSLTQSNIVNGTTCIIVPPNQTDVSNISITGANNLNCQGTQVLIQSSVTSFLMSGNLIYLGANGVNNFGVWIDAPGGVGEPQGAPQGYSIVNNVFGGLAAACGDAVSGEAIVVNTGAAAVVKNGTVTANVFYGLSIGVDLTSATYWNVQANNYDPTTATPVYPPVAINHNSVGVATK